MSKKLILLYSGGRDSTLLLRLAKQFGYDPYCLLFDYGQKHIAELQMAEDMCNKEKVEYSVLRIPTFVSSRLTFGEDQYENVSPWHVPSRNLIFISYASSIAENKRIDLIWFGANYEDRENLFPDCYQEWVYKLNNLLAVNGSSMIRVEAPLLGMSKDTIKSLCKVFEINDNEIFSGYGE
jgi:7-cyano-7-deazaguanine synthase